MFAVIICGCNSESVPVEVVPSEPINYVVQISDDFEEGSWYELPQYYDGVPKYSGGFATYTAKHIPVAIEKNGKVFMTFSDDVYVNGEKRLAIYVSEYINKSFDSKLIKILDDPFDTHQNASIQIDNEGFIHIVISSRGVKYKGYSFISDEPYSIQSFSLYNEHFMAYPQPWFLDSMTYLHTVYFSNERHHTVRELHVINQQCNKKLVSDGHYQLSYFDGSKLHMVYNYHENDSVDLRTNLYYMYSFNGCDWFNSSDEAVLLPLEGNSLDTLIYETENYIYLKDLHIDPDGNPIAIVIESNSASPVEGDRELKAFRFEDNWEEELITTVGHNYNVGMYQVIDGVELFITPTFGEFGYSGSELRVYRKLDVWELESELLDGGNYNYVRKIIGGQGGVTTEAWSSVETKAKVHKLSIFEEYN
jgi:Uma2 family endonuclease